MLEERPFCDKNIHKEAGSPSFTCNGKSSRHREKMNYVVQMINARSLGIIGRIKTIINLH